MSFTIKGKSFTPAPEGLHNAVCVDVVDLGMVPSPWGEKRMVRLIWEIEARRSDGKRFLVSKRYACSIHKKSNLRKDLKTWRGRDFTEEEASEFDLEKVLGVPAQISVSHDTKDGEIYVHVDTVIRATTTKLMPDGNYQRMKDRPDYKPPTVPASSDDEAPLADPPEDDDEPAF